MVTTGIVFEFIGAALIALGLLAIKKPDAWIFRCIFDEASDDELLIIQIRGVVGVIAGIVMMVFDLQNFLV